MNAPELAFAFNPVIIEITATTPAVTIQANGINLQRKVRNGKATFDLQAIARTMFDTSQFGTIHQTDNNLIKTIQITSGNETKNIPLIWGALQIGETYTQTKTLTYFKHLPFTLPLYLAAAKTVRRRYDKTQYTNHINLQPGKYNLPVGNDINPQDKVVFRIDSGDEGVFDYTFDHTFRKISKNTIIITLQVNQSTDGIYLRWINKYGEYNYYLFNPGITAGEIKNTTIDIAEYITTIQYTQGYHPGTAHPQAKQAQQTIKLSAPLIDKDTRTFLQTLPESPVVHLFNGYTDDNTALWTGVNIAPQTTAYDSTPLQDFECTLILPETFTQTL